MPVTFSVNGMPAEFDGPEDVPLLWVVREHLGLTGSKFGCGIGVCGACTMHVDTVPQRTCIMPVILVHSAYWRGLMDWVRGTLVDEGMIDPEDVNLIQVIDEPAQVVKAIFDHYEKRGFEPSAQEREAQLNL